jgi:hypothetical protein
MTALAPWTGLGRADWAAIADRLLASVRPFASDGHALITLPGPPGSGGRAVDGLEGFARTFLLAGFRLAGEGGHDPDQLAEWYAEGLRAGVDPASPERWVRLDEHPQAKVEAASIALVLDLTRPWIWDLLPATTRQHVVDYLAPAVADPTYPRINWVWFRLVVQTFLRSVGGPWSRDDMIEDLATHDSFVRADGWLSDGAERSFDHYAGWALHLYPTLWARMAGAADLAEGRRALDVARLDRFLTDAMALVAGDGSPLIQGRSLTYRFAAAAPFWIGAMAGVPSVGPGALRRAASGILRHFQDHGVPDARGLLTLGWHGAWPRLAQAYSGPGSPYWASKGMIGLALPATHPAWTAPEEALPVERQDTLVAIAAPGWLISGTRGDGIVRAVNHGTDHALEGDRTGDSPLYARLGYSTATSPLLDPDSWTDPLDQSVALVDATGRASHRAGMRLLGVGIEPDGPVEVAVAASVAAAHWLTADGQDHHGSGLTGDVEAAGELCVVSLVRGPWEVRLVRIQALDHELDASGGWLRVGGWAASGPGVSCTCTAARSTATAGGITSRITAISPGSEAGVEVRSDASPLGPVSAVPWLGFAATVGVWTASLIELSARPHPGTARCTTAIGSGGAPDVVSVTWPDGAKTRTRIPWHTSTSTSSWQAPGAGGPGPRL